MNLPINFYEKSYFSITINTIKNHRTEGTFNVEHWGLSKRFNALTYQPTSNFHHFTFSIDWTLTSAGSSTMFAGFLNTNNSSVFLHLNWLVIHQRRPLYGSIRLLENFPEQIDVKQNLPFPILTTITGSPV